MKSATIMVVEDERIVARDVTMMLEELGHEVVGPVGRVEEALTKARDGSLDLAMVDIRLDGPRDGIELARDLRDRFSVSVVYLTAHADEQTLKRASRTTPLGYMTKPVSQMELSATLQVALYNREMEQKIRRSEKLASLGEMAAGLMHEINNPNAFVQGNIEFLSKAWERVCERLPDDQIKNDPGLENVLAEVPECLEGMKKGTRRIEALVNKVKLFSRKQETTGEAERFEPHSEIRDAVEMTRSLSPELDGSSTRMNLDLDEEHPVRLKGDPGEFQQVVVNLLENSLDAVSEEEDGLVQIITEAEGDRFVLEVRDSGKGLTEKEQQNLFVPFYTTKPAGEGMGLGLSIVHGVVERMNGTIDVRSGDEDATVFQVEFPLHEREDDRAT